MNLNTYILADNLSFPVTASRLHSDRLQRPLKSITFYDSNPGNIRKDFATIIDSQDLLQAQPDTEAGCFICPAPASVLENVSVEADILLVDPALSVLAIYQEIQRIFLEFEELDQEMNHLLRQDASLNKFGDTILKYVCNPISLHSEDLRLLFYSERKKPRKLRIYSDEQLNAYPPDDDIEELKVDREFNAAADSTEPSLFYSKQKGNRSLYHNIRIDGIYVARLIFVETDRPLRSGDYALILYLADFITYMIDRKQLTLNNHPRFLDECIMELIKGKEPESRRLYAALHELSWEPDDNFLCITVAASQYDIKTRVITSVALRIENALPGCISIINEDSILVICNLRKSSLPKEELLQKLVYILREGMMKAGISREFSSVLLLRDFYQQTLAALTMGKKKDPMFWTYRFESYALTYLLQNGQSNWCPEALMPSGLRKLMKYDRENNRQFTNSLKIYLREDRHIANTIRKLYMQRATFLYQLKRIQEISGLHLDNPDIRLELLIVFKLLDAD